MVDPSVPETKVADLTAEVETLRARVRDLESQLHKRTSGTHAGAPPTSHPPAGLLKVAVILLGTLVVLMVPPTIMTARRLIRWWQA